MPVKEAAARKRSRDITAARGAGTQPLAAWKLSRAAVGSHGSSGRAMGLQMARNPRAPAKERKREASTAACTKNKAYR